MNFTYKGKTILHLMIGLGFMIVGITGAIYGRYIFWILWMMLSVGFFVQTVKKAIDVKR